MFRIWQAMRIREQRGFTTDAENELPATSWNESRFDPGDNAGIPHGTCQQMLALFLRPSYRESMSKTSSQSTRNQAAWSNRFAATVTVGVLLASLVAAVGDPTIEFLFLGVLLSVAVGLGWECLHRMQPKIEEPTLLETPLVLSHDSEAFEIYRQIAQSLLKVTQHTDPIYREVALAELCGISKDVEQIAGGTIVFEGTETWRLVYEKLLRSPGLHLYQSVAWVKNANYWQDTPGRHSTQLNLDLHESGRLNIERIVILADDVWPAHQTLPVERIHRWIREQHDCGIWIKLVRESKLTNEPELLQDLGIYGSRAVGVQELGDECETVRFTLRFGFDEVSRAEERWGRLAVYSISYAEYLDQYDLDA